MSRVTYDPSVFRVKSIEEAKRIILTPEPGTTTEERWRQETAFLVDVMASHLGLAAGHLMVDFGSGIGRLSRAAVERTPGLSVLGVDISPEMRALGNVYCDSRFVAFVSVEFFDLLVAQGIHPDAGVCCWVLQHSATPDADVARLAHALKPGARLLVLNGPQRLVPTKAGWAEDDINVEHLLLRRFREVARVDLPTDIFVENLRGSWLGVYEKTRNSGRSVPGKK